MTQAETLEKIMSNESGAYASALSGATRSPRVICVTSGKGGVGKTTTSAVLAMHAALEGRKVIVCTVDPAKRLANSLGVDELGDKEKRIPPETFKELEAKPGGEHPTAEHPAKPAAEHPAKPAAEHPEKPTVEKPEKPAKPLDHPAH